MFFLQRECEAVDDGSKDLKQFRNTIVSLSVVDELEEYVGNGSTDESTQIEELAVDAVQGCL